MAVTHFDAANFGAGNDTVEHVLDLLGQALSILDDENLLVAAAKVEDARTTLSEFVALT